MHVTYNNPAFKNFGERNCYIVPFSHARYKHSKGQQSSSSELHVAIGLLKYSRFKLHQNSFPVYL